MKYLRISRHGKVRGGMLDDDDDVEEGDSDYKLSPSADEDEFDADAPPGARGPRTTASGAAAGGRGLAGGVTGETAWRMSGAARRKRLSLPAIRLYFIQFRSNRPHYGSCPFVCPCVCSFKIQAPNSLGYVENRE